LRMDEICIVLSLMRLAGKLIAVHERTAASGFRRACGCPHVAR
jgi:hypothetical protein